MLYFSQPFKQSFLYCRCSLMLLMLVMIFLLTLPIITSSTKLDLPFADKLSHLSTEILVVSHLLHLNYVTKSRQFFFAPLRSSLDIKKLNRARKSTLNKTPKCANHEQFCHTMKRLSCGNFTSSSNVILQCTCFDLSDTRIDSTITYYLFTSGYFIFARKITWSTVCGSIKLLD